MTEMLEEGYAPAARRLKERAAQRARMRAIERLRSQMAWMTGTLVVFAALFLAVYSTMQVSQLTEEATRLQRGIDSLAEQEALLITQHENKISIAEIERIAKEELGMEKLTREQITYIDLSGDDYVIRGGETESHGFLQDIWRFVMSLLA